MSTTNQELLKAALQFAEAFSSMVSGLKPELESAKSGDKGMVGVGKTSAPIGAPITLTATPTAPIGVEKVSAPTGSPITLPETTTVPEPKPVSKPSTTTRVRAPVEQQSARDFLAGIDPDEAEDVVVDATANLLSDMKQYLVNTNALVNLPSRDELAKAMSREQSTTVEIAMGTIKNNKGRGFTAPNGTVYVSGVLPTEMLDGEPDNVDQAADHDAVHESVHLMSAPGGATKILAEQGEQCNEGFTEYFAKRMCAKLGVQDVLAYPDHVAFVTKLVPVVGFPMIYTAYMKNGGIDPIVAKLTDVWIGKNDALLGDTKKKVHAAPKVRGSSDINREAAVTKISNYFKNNFPPTGAALNFWNAVFFG
jgi:hypothetical protein